MSLRALVELTKAGPDPLHYVSTGVGSSSHLTTELFKSTAGASMNHVPYKGGAPAITDVLGAHLRWLTASSRREVARGPQGQRIWVRPQAIVRCGWSIKVLGTAAWQ